MDFADVEYSDYADMKPSRLGYEKRTYNSKLGLLATYAFCFVFMAVARKKALSHSLMIKSSIMMLVLAMDISQPYFYSDEENERFASYRDKLIVIIRDYLLSYEEAVSILLLGEMYLCVCKMETRKYSVGWFLLKAVVLFVICFVWTIGFQLASGNTDLDTGLLIHHRFAWADIPWSFIVTISLSFLGLKMIISLVKSGKFRDKFRGNDFFLIGLLIITMASQVGKLCLVTSEIIQDHHSRKIHDICHRTTRPSIIMKCWAAFSRTMYYKPFLTAEYSGLIEYVFCMAVFSYRKLHDFVTST